MFASCLRPHHRLLLVRRLAVLAFVFAAVLWPGVAAGAPPVLGTNGAAVPQLDWGACPAATPEEEGFLRPYRCTTVEVPLSYRDPSGQSIELALGMLPAADPAHKLGTLFWNPGGPGGSGRIPPLFSDALHARFDIVGFDPRGVAASTPLQCFATNQQAFRLLGWDFPITLAQERRVIRLTGRASKLCARNGGPLLEHMTTANVARDVDLLRQAVGDDQLSYIGFSYGTHLGEVYANLFPDRVRAITLDAVLDPVEWTTGELPADALAPFSYRLGSHLGADQALSTFLAACAGDQRCAFREAGVDLRRKYDRLLARLRRRPVQIVLPDGEQIIVDYQLAVNVTLGSLYDPAASRDLADALEMVWVATERRSVAPVRVRAGIPCPTTSPTPASSGVRPCSAPTRATRGIRSSGHASRAAQTIRRIRSALPGSTLRCPARPGRSRTPTAIRGRGTGPRPIPCCSWATGSATRPHPTRAHNAPRRSVWRTPDCSAWTRSDTRPSSRAPASERRSTTTSSTSRCRPRAPSASRIARPLTRYPSRPHSSPSRADRHNRPPHQSLTGAGPRLRPCLSARHPNDRSRPCLHCDGNERLDVDSAAFETDELRACRPGSTRARFSLAMRRPGAPDVGQPELVQGAVARAGVQRVRVAA
jgi:pimeloyl-ACP methyl ester carboxylesterase